MDLLFSQEIKIMLEKKNFLDVLRFCIKNNTMTMLNKPKKTRVQLLSVKLKKMNYCIFVVFIIFVTLYKRLGLKN